MMDVLHSHSHCATTRPTPTSSRAHSRREAPRARTRQSARHRRRRPLESLPAPIALSSLYPAPPRPPPPPPVRSHSLPFIPCKDGTREISATRWTQFNRAPYVHSRSPVYRQPNPTSAVPSRAAAPEASYVEVYRSRLPRRIAVRLATHACTLHCSGSYPSADTTWIANMWCRCSTADA
ncbi:hypothetical protein BD413DRAFT_173076 [Trametes elegans]|nr:hypothetical protein BD413DRAFT_173076 [Trametes elegans]